MTFIIEGSAIVLNEAISIIMTMIVLIILIWVSMWGFYKFMYPRAPKSMMPKKGDVTTPRQCNFCGHRLAEYRGVLETRAVDADVSNTDASDTGISDNKLNNTANSKQNLVNNNELFFCNYEHQADYHAGKSYTS